ncbi:hypothetical protein T4D_10900 [Trichinella pseudospiralis]|uniref:Uncharacterized protein n=1 Tax=Trichinella pseudospiralis TaxID=6337 RepID=A0A0V1DM43_TRIPS|nr:hypothetical protein T4D_10900 [Trichinella pseudospiralis]
MYYHGQRKVYQSKKVQILKKNFWPFLAKQASL